MPKLTKRLVDAAKKQDTDYFIWDNETAGFGLRVFATGRKSYLVQYRSGGRTRRVTVGKVGAMTPDEARKKAREILVSVSSGENPAEDIRQRRASPTMAELCKRFMTDHVANRCKPSTEEEYRRSVDLFIKPEMGNHKVVDITRADIAKLHHDMRDKPYQANRTLGVLSKMFNLAEVWGIRADGSNPCRHVKKYKEEKRERFLSPDELARLGKVFAESEADGSESKSAVLAFRLLILTGCRLGEIQTLKWAYVKCRQVEAPDGESEPGKVYWLALPDSKTGAKKVWLGQEAADVLEAAERLEDNEYVITGEVEGQYLTDLQKPWRRIRKRAKLEDVRIHDLRHSFASVAVCNGESLHMTGKLLGHTLPQTTSRYAHLADDPMQGAAGRVSSRIAEMMGTQRS